MAYSFWEKILGQLIIKCSYCIGSQNSLSHYVFTCMRSDTHINVQLKLWKVRWSAHQKIPFFKTLQRIKHFILFGILLCRYLEMYIGRTCKKWRAQMITVQPSRWMILITVVGMNWQTALVGYALVCNWASHCTIKFTLPFFWQKNTTSCMYEGSFLISLCINTCSSVLLISLLSFIRLNIGCCYPVLFLYFYVKESIDMSGGTTGVRCPVQCM